MDGQLVEYLGAGWESVANEIPGVLQAGDEVLALSIRPDPLTSFYPHDICLTSGQALRLLNDLQNLFDSQHVRKAMT